MATHTVPVAQPIRRT